MASLEYSISELHTLLELHIRNSMSLNNRSDLHDIAVQNKNYILQQGNPVYNKLYKNMKLSTLTDHINQSGGNVKKLWDIEDHNYDYIIDDGQIEEKNMLSSMSYNKPRVLNPYSNRSNLNKYQPYFKPTGRISDFAVAHSTGMVGLKMPSRSIIDTTIGYSDYYNDKDLNCVTVIVDVGKNSTIRINEDFLNKDGCKIYKIIYLVRDYAILTLDRKFEIDGKDKGINIIETNVVQFPGSTFNYNVQGEGSKHNQDLMYVDVYDKCKTNIEGKFYLYDNFVNNSIVDVHHIGQGSISRVDVRSIVDDKSHSSFLGSITVDKEATDTDAQLVNKNLLLSNNATAITEPQLDINTKEITCSHGCTVSNVDKEQLYFLESRGIETNMAEETLKQCFLTM